MKSRSKLSSSSSSSASTMAKSSSTSSSSSSYGSSTVAAVSVTKFGQATFTSVRHRKNIDSNENGNYVPLLKKTKYEHHDPMDDLIMMKMEQKHANNNLKNTSNNNDNSINETNENNPQKSSQETKPRVYKFFKSRSSMNQNNNSNNNVNSSPMANVSSGLQSSAINNSRLSSNSSSSSANRSSSSSSSSIVLNNFANQKQSRITYSGRIKSDNNVSQTNSSKVRTTNLNDTTNNNNNNNNKSCEIKICGDKTIKKIISPNKITEFHIRNNSTSNVRNATIKPIQPATNITSLSASEAQRGIRSSRRLKGIEPEQQQQQQTSPMQQSSGIHFTYEKKSIPSQSITTMIEEVIDNKSNDSNQEQTELRSEQTNDETLENLPENSNDATVNNESIEEHEKEKSSSPEASEHFTAVKDVEEEKQIESETKSQTNDQGIEMNIDQNSSNSQEEKSDSQQSAATNIADIPSNENETKSNENEMPPPPPPPAPLPAARPPKKKIFSNREHRNRIEFDAKNFFTSEITNEFDDEIQKTSTNAATDNDKKTSNDNDDNDYIKLKRIKKAHQCHELGETEQFDEDIKYYLSGIVSSNPNSMRCLSILGLTQQAMRPEFRMHLRAHDDMPRIIKALMDAPQDSNLAICTACLMFIYNQDRLTMDIDPNALSLMLELLETRSDECNQVEEKHRTKVRSLVEEMKNKGHAQYLKLNEITAGKLAMETLLGLTSKRAGDWFKVELRRMKGIDFIVNTVMRCAEKHTEEGQIVKIDRCMHVFENVTFNNVENQLYIVNYDESKFISTCIKLLIECKKCIISMNESKVYLSAFFSILRVLTNLTSESVDGCKIVGKFDGIIELLLESLFELPSFIMSDQRFDLMVIIICLCINLAAFCEHIREIIMTSETRNYLGKLCDLLFKKIDEAEQVEKQTDHLLESHETIQMTEAMQDNLLMQMISKSGTHMEHSLLSACVCLLLGCCIQDNKNFTKLLSKILPNNSFKPLIEQLKKLRDFAHLADIMTQKGKERVQKVLQLFETCNNNNNTNTNNENNNDNDDDEDNSLMITNDESIIDDDDVDDGDDQDDDDDGSVNDVDDNGDGDDNITNDNTTSNDNNIKDTYEDNK